MEFREANSGDIPVLLELEQAVVEAERPFNEAIRPGRPTYYDLDDLITSEQAQLLVAEHADAIVATGYAQIRPSKASLRHTHHAYLGFMYVSPEHRGQGINQSIIEQLVHWGRSRGVTDFYLDVYAQNAGAIRAYEKSGFESSLIEMKLSLG